MANAFQDMLEVFGLTKKILAVNADNASSNDTDNKARSIGQHVSQRQPSVMLQSHVTAVHKSSFETF